ncbi:EamA family transporter [Pendulispora albinea]|uniref:DMT family transporter n=1 Tax=Pendulispora albinea TaxID=2741071 RepID=A0ABZ2M4T5_9BACT
MVSAYAVSPDSKSSARPSLGVFLVFLSTVCFGTAGPAVKALLLVGLSPLEVVLLRVTGAAILLTLIAFARDPKSLRVTPRDLPFLLAYGLLAFFGVQALYFVALSRLAVGVALLLEYLAIVLVAFWARFVEKRRLARTTWLGIGFAVAGLGLIEQVWKGLTLDGLGALAGLGAAVCLAAYFLLGERGTRGRDPFGLSAMGALVGAVASNVISPMWRLPLDSLTNSTQLGPVSVPAWAALAYVVVIGTVAAYVTGLLALRHLPSPVAGVLSTFEVVVASATAWLLLGETLSAIELAGAATLFVGVILAQIGRAPAEPEPLKDASSSTPRRSHDGAASSPR